MKQNSGWPAVGIRETTQVRLSSTNDAVICPGMNVLL